MTNPADELHAFAALLRESYAALTSYVDVRGPIGLEHWSEWFGPEEPGNLPVVNRWIALMDPALAEPLAALIDTIAAMTDGLTEREATQFSDTWQAQGLAVARAIRPPAEEPR